MKSNREDNSGCGFTPEESQELNELYQKPKDEAQAVIRRVRARLMEVEDDGLTDTQRLRHASALLRLLTLEAMIEDLRPPSCGDTG